MRSTIEALLVEQVDQLTDSAELRRLETGVASPAEYDDFLANLIRTHLRSTQLVAFLYALAPPGVSAAVLHNLLEELGEDEDGTAHPEMLHALAVRAGLGPVLPELERLADNDLRSIVSEPLLFGSLREVGLAALCEVVAFELMLSRVAGRIERALAAHRGLSREALTWFSSHSEIDVAHAEQGLRHIEEHIRYYGLGPEDAEAIVRLTLRENVFLKRYFAQQSPTSLAATGR